MLPRKTNALLIEDSSNDAELMKQAFHELEADITLHHVPSVVAALSFLFKEGRFPHAATPDVILLDLSLPNIPGEEALKIIRQTRDLDDTPIIVFTASEDKALHARCLTKGATAIWVKPPTWSEYLHLVNIIRECLKDHERPTECIEEHSAEL